MGSGNQTLVIEFIFLSFSNIPELQVGLLVLFSFLYVIILLGNVSIMVLVPSDRRLHTPMYFFLANLSFFELCCTCTVVPMVLANFLIMNPSISVTGCSFQMFFFTSLASAECFLLAVMSFDRYAAICIPLRYSTIMSMCLCIKFVASSFFLSAILSSVLAILIFRLPFCQDNHIQHIFCEIPVVLSLACTDTSVHQAAVYIVGMLVLTVPFLFICISYGFIISSVVRLPSAQGRYKAFSTCTSHLSVDLLQYGIASFIYLRPKSMRFPDMDKLVSLVYVFGTPLVNPLIYTLRNKDMKAAWYKVFITRKCGGVKSVGYRQ